MKLSRILLAAVLFLTSYATSGYSGQREFQGLPVGAGGVSIIGHALGGNAESAIIGSALGGIVGLTAGSIYAGSYHRTEAQYHRYNNHRSYRDRRQNHYQSYWPSKKYYPDCRVIKKRICKHGQSFLVTKRICKEQRTSHSKRNYKPGRHNKFHNRY